MDLEHVYKVDFENRRKKQTGHVANKHTLLK